MKEALKNIITGPGLYHFFIKVRPYLGKYLFLLVCLGSLIWYTIYTRSIIGKFQEEAVQVTQTYAELIRTAISEHMNNEQMNIVFEEIIQKSNNPIIITDTLWTPIMWKNVTTGSFLFRKKIPNETENEKIRSVLQKKVHEYKKLYEPKPLYIHETQTKIGYLVFGNNNLLSSLAWIPFLEIGIITVFLLFAYLAFHNIRVTERSNLWVGLAKETAHQLGTPISSLMGWLEYMRSTDDEENPIEPELIKSQLNTICDNIEKDLKRLRKVTDRFSQIGSIPTLTKCTINEALRDVLDYYRVRLPLVRKRIELEPRFGLLPPVDANRDLIEWVFENLIKNSIDAITAKEGKIELKTEYSECDRVVRIYHSDNGKGISWDDRKRIFAPGYTTKKRGWGLGLTLAKRIIEDYHRGKIYVSSSQKDKGTVFCIELPVKTVRKKGRTTHSLKRSGQNAGIPQKSTMG